MPKKTRSIAEGIFSYFNRTIIFVKDMIAKSKSSYINVNASQPNINPKPNCIPRTSIIGTLSTILFNFFEIPNMNQKTHVPKPIEITRL